MILAALLLLAQDAPPPRDPEAANSDQGEEIVVQAVLGRTTMLFDKGPDGKLKNCRVMKSSGSVRRDLNACQTTPVCFDKTREQVPDCVELAITEVPSLSPRPAAGDGVGTGVQTFTPDTPLTLPKTPIAPVAIGPQERVGDSRERDRQAVKLPPLPTPPASGPAITISGSNDGQSRDGRDRRLDP